MVEYRSHHRVRMGGRDPSETHRTATPLELLFDLTFVIAFGAAANELAHQLAEGHIAAALLGFGFATFGIAWAWINFSWFASAYDTDDWVFRLATMVQMLGVLIFALGLPDMFASLHEGDMVDNRVMVAGYVVMRLALVFQWLRAARQDPPRRAACQKYVWTLLVAQAGWVVLPWPRRPSASRSCGSPSCCSWSWPGRCSPRPARAARRGTPTTSPSATGCW